MINSIRFKRVLSLLLVLAILIPMLPTEVIASTNVGAGKTKPTYGDGDNAWMMGISGDDLLNPGIRVSLYWAEDDEAFNTGEAIQLGKIIDVLPDGPRYLTERFTGASVYDYMSVNSALTRYLPQPKGTTYKYFHKNNAGSDIVETMPHITNSSQEEWHEWIETKENGEPTYTNIPKLTVLTGHTVTADNFKTGIFLEDDGTVAKGKYKIFLEPLASMVVNGDGVIMSLRDAIAWERDYLNKNITTKNIKNSSGVSYNPSIVNALGPAIPFLANSLYLIEDEPSIQMSANSSKYNVKSDKPTQRKEIQPTKKVTKQTEGGQDYQVWEQGRIYSSMGVGVVTSPGGPVEDAPILIKSYVKVVGYDSNGKYILEEGLPTEKEVISLDDPRFDKNTGILQLTGREELETGEAFLNDIITSPKDLSKKGNVEDLDWIKSKTPELGGEKVNLNSLDISRFLFGIVSGEPLENESGVVKEEDNNSSGYNLLLNNAKISGKPTFMPDGASTNAKAQANKVYVPSPLKNTAHELAKEYHNNMKAENNKINTLGGPIATKSIADDLRILRGGLTGSVKPTPTPSNDVGKVYTNTSSTVINTTTIDKGKVFIEPAIEEANKTVIDNNIDPDDYIELEDIEPKVSISVAIARIAVALDGWSEVPLSKESDFVLKFETTDHEKLGEYSKVLSDLSDNIFTLDTKVANLLKDNTYEGMEKSEKERSYEENIKIHDKIISLQNIIAAFVYENDELSNNADNIADINQKAEKSLEAFRSLYQGFSNEHEQRESDYVDNGSDYIDLENNNSNLIEIKEEELKSGGEGSTSSTSSTGGVSLMTDGEYNVAYLRYIYFPTSSQINVIELKENGVATGEVHVTWDKLDIVEMHGQEYVEIKDIRTDNFPDAKFNHWYADSNFELDEKLIPRTAPTNNYPNDGSYDLTKLQTIEGLPPGLNIYTFWEMNVDHPPTGSGDVPEWRLSKFNEEFIPSGSMFMTLQTEEWGNYSNELIPEGSYEGKYKTYNPNNIETSKTYNPPSMNLTPVVNAPWYHSGITNPISNSELTINSLTGVVNFGANLNMIKSETLGGFRTANWVNSNTPLIPSLDEHGIKEGNMGKLYSGNDQETKVSNFEYKLLNSVSFTHRYVNRYPVYFLGMFVGYRYVPGSYTMTPEYINYKVNDVTTVFDRYIPVNTDSRMLNNVAPVKVENNGKTTVAMQENYTMNIYPEVAMLFANDRGNENIVFVSGDLVRKIKPISFHSLEHKVFVEAKSVGTSVATTITSKQTANAVGVGNNPVIHKGGGVNTTFDIKDKSGGSSRGYLEVRSYVLDIGTSSLKTAWGNSFSTSTVKDNFLNLWTFKGKGSSKLEVTVPNGSNVAYDGPLKINNIDYTKGSESLVKHRLTVRGGILTHVNNVPIATVKTSNPDLYEALEGMKLVGSNKDNTVLTTFERQRGKALEEDTFRTMATSSRNNISSDLVLNQGWYNEDSTVLVVTEYVTRYNVPNSMYSDKLPMTIQGLETPVNKMDYYKKMSLGHTFLNYTIESSPVTGLGNIKSFFEMTTRTNGTFNNRAVNYGVPNVSISDTTGLF